jgi:hypothetical protein
MYTIPNGDMVICGWYDLVRSFVRWGRRSDGSALSDGEEIAITLVGDSHDTE